MTVAPRQIFAFERRCRVINSHAFELLTSLSIQPAVIRAGRDQHTFRPENRSATVHLQTGCVFAAALVMNRKRLGRRGKFRAEPIGLKLGEPRQIAAAHAGRKAEKVFDQ